MSVDLHTAQIQGFFDGPVDHLFALPLLADYVEEKYAEARFTVVSPDSGRVRVAERWTDRLGGCPLAFIHKTRDPLKPNEVVAHRVVGEVAGRSCIVVDDMIDTGARSSGRPRRSRTPARPTSIIAATHGILSGPAIDRLKNSPISEVVADQHAADPAGEADRQLTVLSIAPLIARAIHEVFEDGSVTSLFDGAS